MNATLPGERLSKMEVGRNRFESMWLVTSACCIASSFFLAAGLTLTKIGFGIFFLGLVYARRQQLGSIPRPGICDGCFLVFLLTQFCSLLVARDLSAALTPASALVYCGLLYAATRIALRADRRRAEVLWSGLVAAACLSSAVGILQVATGRFYMPGTEGRSMLTEGSFRANGLFDDPNYFGFLLTIAWPLAVRRLKGAWRVLTLVLLTLGILLSLSRATWLIFVVQLVLLSWLASRARLLALVWSCAAIIAIAAVVVAFDPFGALSRFDTLLPLFIDTGGGLENSAAERLDLMHAGMRMFLDRPWLGVGFGNFQVLSPEYMEFFPRNVYAHNTYLTIAAETGIPGIAAYLALLFVMARRLAAQAQYHVLVALAGLAASNFFLVAHYFPVANLFLAGVASFISGADPREVRPAARTTPA